MIKRRETKTVRAGKVHIGSGYPVSIQSMTKTDTRDVEATLKQVRELENCGCEIIRVAVKDMRAAEAVGKIKDAARVPIVADIHFDHKLALEVMRKGVDKIRINPGNMTKKDDLDRIIDAAGSKDIPVRIGVNSGSLPGGKVEHHRVPGTMVKLALETAELFKKRNFENIVISLKAADVLSTIEAYRQISADNEYPLHLGVTASGLPGEGVVSSSVGIGALLSEGIGDTIRVSLTGDPVNEVVAAKRILTSLGLRNFGPRIISCPTCGRCSTDIVAIARELETELQNLVEQGSIPADKQLIIAVMGCEVNGPGESKNADIGIAFGSDKGVIFAKGEVVKTVNPGESVSELVAMIKEL